MRHLPFHDVFWIAHCQCREDLKEPVLRDVDGIKRWIVEITSGLAETAENLCATAILFPRDNAKIDGATIIDIAVDMVNLLAILAHTNPSQYDKQVDVVLFAAVHHVRIARSVRNTVGRFLAVVLLAVVLDADLS